MLESERSPDRSHYLYEINKLWDEYKKQRQENQEFDFVSEMIIQELFRKQIIDQIKSSNWEISEKMLIEHVTNYILERCPEDKHIDTYLEHAQQNFSKQIKKLVKLSPDDVQMVIATKLQSFLERNSTEVYKLQGSFIGDKIVSMTVIPNSSSLEFDQKCLATRLDHSIDGFPVCIDLADLQIILDYNGYMTAYFETEDHNKLRQVVERLIDLCRDLNVCLKEEGRR